MRRVARAAPVAAMLLAAPALLCLATAQRQASPEPEITVYKVPT